MIEYYNCSCHYIDYGWLSMLSQSVEPQQLHNSRSSIHSALLLWFLWSIVSFQCCTCRFENSIKFSGFLCEVFLSNFVSFWRCFVPFVTLSVIQFSEYDKRDFFQSKSRIITSSSSHHSAIWLVVQKKFKQPADKIILAAGWLDSIREGILYFHTHFRYYVSFVWRLLFVQRLVSMRSLWLRIDPNNFT